MNGQRGFTVVEALVAVVILSVGIMALVGGSALGARLLGTGRIVTRAVEAGNSRLEEIRRLAGIQWGSPPSRCSAPGFPTGTGSSTVQGVGLTWNVPASGDTRVVTVTVTYSRIGGSGSFTLATVIACR